MVGVHQHKEASMPQGIEFTVNEKKFKVLSEYRGVESPLWDQGNHPAFDILISMDGSDFAKFEYYGSIQDFNNGKDELDRWEHCSVAQMIMSDASTGFEDFEDMLSNLGCEDNKESRAIYRSCVETYDKFDQILRLRDDDLITTYNAMIDFENEESTYGTLKKEEIEIDDIKVADFEPSRVENFDWSKMNWWEGDNENLTEQTLRRKYEDMKDSVQEIKELIDGVAETFEKPVDYDWGTTIDDVEKKLNFQEFMVDELDEENADKYADEYNKLHTELISEMRALEPDPLETPEKTKEILSKFIDHVIDGISGVESRVGINFEENEFEESLDEVVGGYFPMMNAAWRLDNKPSDTDVEDILKHAPNVSIVSIGDENYIAMNGAGFDMSQSIGYAYLKIDKDIPKELGVYRKELMSGSEEAFQKVTEFLAKREIKEMTQNAPTGGDVKEALKGLEELGKSSDLNIK